jgi:hypothetical protein
MLSRVPLAFTVICPIKGVPTQLDVVFSGTIVYVKVWFELTSFGVPKIVSKLSEILYNTPLGSPLTVAVSAFIKLNLTVSIGSPTQTSCESRPFVFEIEGFGLTVILPEIPVELQPLPVVITL